MCRVGLQCWDQLWADLPLAGTQDGQASLSMENLIWGVLGASPVPQLEEGVSGGFSAAAVAWESPTQGFVHCSLALCEQHPVGKSCFPVVAAVPQSDGYCTRLFFLLPKESWVDR